MDSEQGLTLAVIASYAVLRYCLGLAMPRLLALVVTALALAAVGFAALGLFVGSRVAGALFICAIADGLWIAFGRRPLNIRH